MLKIGRPLTLTHRSIEYCCICQIVPPGLKMNECVIVGYVTLFLQGTTSTSMLCTLRITWFNWVFCIHQLDFKFWNVVIKHLVVLTLECCDYKSRSRLMIDLLPTWSVHENLQISLRTLSQHIFFLGCLQSEEGCCYTKSIWYRLYRFNWWMTWKEQKLRKILKLVYQIWCLF